jgi:hypothetical protein
MNFWASLLILTYKQQGVLIEEQKVNDSILFTHWITSQGGTKTIPQNSISIPSSFSIKPHRNLYKQGKSIT